MYRIYQVQANDTLESLANRFGTTVEELMKINGSMGSNIVPGQYIIVPTSTPQLFQVYVIEKGDTAYSIAQAHNTNYKDLLQLNGLLETDYLYPGQEILVPKEGTVYYITKEGDTIDRVSQFMGISPLEILLQNESVYLMPDQLLTYQKGDKK